MPDPPTRSTGRHFPLCNLGQHPLTPPYPSRSPYPSTSFDHSAPRLLHVRIQTYSSYQHKPVLGRNVIVGTACVCLWKPCVPPVEAVRVPVETVMRFRLLLCTLLEKITY